jgi:hypothetical protein
MDKRVKRTDVTDDLPRSPTGRVPKWVIEEAAGRQVEPEVWRPPGSPLHDLPKQKFRRRRRSGWVWVAAVVLVAMAVGVGSALIR